MTENEGELRLPKLCRLYQLDEVRFLAVVLAFARQLDPKYEKAILMLQGDSGRRGVDPFLLRALAEYLKIGDEQSLLSFSGASRRKEALFEVREDTQLFLRANVVAWLRGLDGETDLQQDGFLLYPVSEEASVIRIREAEWVSAVAGRHLEQAAGERLAFELQGRPGAGKKRFSQDVAGRLGHRLCVIRLSDLLEQRLQEGLDLLSRSFFACRVNGCIPYLDLVNCPDRDAKTLYLIENIVQRFPLIFIGSVPDQDVTQKLPFATQKLSLDRLSMDDNLALWRQVGSRYPVAEDVVYEQLAGKYRLLPTTICEVFTRAEQRRWERGMERIDGALLLSCVRECNQWSENALMERIHTVFRWEDLKVKPETARAMQLACAHLKHSLAAQEYLGGRYPYGDGVSVLMYGPPGTGKTMAAQVIANELQMDLCRVNLSQISSKYIGETEKNLEKVFREAEQSNVILFFD
jgi:tRNA A37 threonylcarbamoyladenosine biosynthesis protein TsaE